MTANERLPWLVGWLVGWEALHWSFILIRWSAFRGRPFCGGLLGMRQPESSDQRTHFEPLVSRRRGNVTAHVAAAPINWYSRAPINRRFVAHVTWWVHPPELWIILKKLFIFFPNYFNFIIWSFALFDFYPPSSSLNLFSNLVNLKMSRLAIV